MLSHSARQDLKEVGRSKYTSELRSAAGLEPSIPSAGAYLVDSDGKGKYKKLTSPLSSPGELAIMKAYCEGVQTEGNACSEMPSGGRDGYTAEAVSDRPRLGGQYHTHSQVPAIGNHCSKPVNETRSHSAVPSSSVSEKAVHNEARDNTYVASVRAGADKALDQQEKTFSLSKLSLDVRNALTSDKPEAHTKRDARSRMMSSVGHTRREQAGQDAKFHEAFPMAAGWGALTLAALLERGLLKRKSKICAISEEATASAVLRKTLEVRSFYAVTGPLGTR